MSIPDVIKKGDPFGPAKMSPLENAVIEGLTGKEFVHRTGKRLYAGDSGFCPRKAVMSMLAPEDQIRVITPVSTLYMTAGKDTHRVITDAFQNKGILLSKEFKIADMGINVGGYVDAIIILDGEIRAVEIKTCGQLPSKPKLAYYSQGAVYTLATGFPTSLLFISRNVAEWTSGRPHIQIREIPIMLTERDAKGILLRLAETYVYANAELRPPIPLTITSQRDCTYCPFVAGCWGDWDCDGGEAGLFGEEPTHEQAIALSKQIDKITEELWGESRERYEYTTEFLRMHGSSLAQEIFTDPKRSYYFLDLI